MSKSFDVEAFGDEMKMFERIYAGHQFIPNLPICIRLDGKGFSKYTSKLKRPFDETFSQIMKDVTKFLIQETNAIVGYTQSDEISLILYSDDHKKEVYFNGKIQKLISVLASMATAKFNELAYKLLPQDKIPKLAFFDCRAWLMPNKEKAVDVLYWREIDATKNSISMATRSVYKTSEMMNKKANEMKDMLVQKGINWNEYPSSFKRGTYLQKRTELKTLTEEELNKIPKEHQPKGKIERSSVIELNLPPMSKIMNKVQVIFDKAESINYL